MHRRYQGCVSFCIRRVKAYRAVRSAGLCLAAMIAFILSFSIAGGAEAGTAGRDGLNKPAGDEKAKAEIVLQIVFDNNPLDERLETSWGFGCVITGCEKTILFDTGGDGKMLLRNMEKCGIDPKEIDAVVLSHIHGDHTAGLAEFLKVNRDVEVYLPKVFPAQFKEQVRRTAAKVVETDKPQKVCEGAWTTGVLGRQIPEQGMYVKSAEGILVVTGCAHPGVVQITEAAKVHAKEPVRFVVGGFHLGGASASQIRQVIEGLNRLDVKQVAPTHCTGDKARAQMKEALGKRYVAVGVGGRMVFPAPAQEKTSSK